MKRTFSVISLLAVCTCSFAQQTRQPSQDNPSMLVYQTTSTRTEIILPEVNGFKAIKTDLHVHTFFSDGNIAPAYRVTEGWRDGLDAIAITDHIEYRPTEKQMKKFLRTQAEEVKDGYNFNFTSDLNYSVSLAKDKAEQMGITLIPGCEITRNPVETGHFCALFTSDNNLIPDEDPLVSVRNAKKQGAMVQINHPGWRNKSNEFTVVAKAALKENLVDGVEVFNSPEFYPDVIEKGVRMGLYIAGNTDIHGISSDSHRLYGVFRNMTIVFANDNSLGNIREGLENKRTIAYSYGDIAGSESLLKDFFKAAVEIKVLYTDSKGAKQVQITNKSSFYYTLSIPGQSIYTVLDGLSSIICKVSGDSLPVTVCNMWFGDGKHPSVSLDITR